MQWHNEQPIYQQLKDKIVALILAGNLAEGEAIPSIRQISAEYCLNPLTVSKAYQALVDIEILEKKRGLGMFVIQGAKQRLLEHEKTLFLTQQWPTIMKKIQSLGLTVEDLLP